MSKNYKSKQASSRKHVIRRRVIVFSLFAVMLGLVTFLGWQVVQSISAAITTGDQPVSTSDMTTTPASTTTTTRRTMTVNAQLTCPRILVYDDSHSSVLYSQNADERCYPASLTKILTAIIATEECEQNEDFTVGSELSLLQPNSSTAGLKNGYRLTRDMIIDAMLIPSGNDAAYTIAAHIGRKLSGNPDLSDLEAVYTFADKMNTKAEELGAVNSHFSNPDGYFASDHYTTASDMLKIAKAARQYDNLRETIAKATAHYVLLSGEEVTFNNTNAIINPSSPYYVEGATGMKTGFTDEAGYCVIASAERNDVDIIAVVMGGLSSDQRWIDAVELLSDAFAVYETMPAA